MSHTPRKKKLNKPKLQLKMIGVFLAISSFAAFGQALLLSQSLMEVGLRIEDTQVARTVQDAMPGLLMRNLLWTALFLLPFMLVVGVHVTHRIAGPAYRMRMYCNEIAASGEVTYKCRIRQHDELQSMCEVLNEAVSAVQRAAGTPSQTPSNPSAKDVETAPSLVADQRSQPADAEAK
ncbi:MAG: hypothetical protein R3F17_08720 [Planctomycetota bacterium]